MIASVGVACLLLGGAIASRGPALERAPESPAAGLEGGVAASAGKGGIVEYDEKDAAPKKTRRHRFHQPHELPDESLPSGWGQGDHHD